MSNTPGPVSGEHDSQPSESAPSGSRSRRGTLIAAGVAGALVLGGGATWATGIVGKTSTQPEDVLPAGAMFFAKVDLDPGVAQKVGAFRLFDKLPDAKKALTDNDPKKALFGLAQRESSDLKSVDYAKDIEPWLGDRAGIALLAPDKAGAEPVVVAALAVKDEAKAKEAFARAGAAGQTSLDKAAGRASSALRAGPTSTPSASTNDAPVTVYKDGYVLMASQKDKAKVDAAVAGATLTSNETFTKDMDAVGETGVASGWLDSGAFMKYAQSSSASGSGDAFSKEMATLNQGRSAFAVRFGSDHLELAQVTRGAAVGVPNAPALKDVKNLPADTAAFMSFTGGSQYLAQIWPIVMKAAKSEDPKVDSEIQKFEKDTGFAIPEDIQTILGNQFDLVVGKQKLADANPDNVAIGARLWTDTAKAQSILEKINTLMQSAQSSSGSAEVPGISLKTNGEHLDVALNQGYRDRMSSAGGLGNAPAFATVLPDIDKAAGALYVDLDAIESEYLDMVPADKRELVRSLQAVGMTAGPLVDGEQRSTLRLSVN